jgi:hypothetical protein
MIEHETVDRTQAACKLEGIDEFLIASNGHFDAVRRNRSYSCTQRQPLGAVADKFEKAFGLKSSVKNDRGDLVHIDPIVHDDA